MSNRTFATEDLAARISLHIQSLVPQGRAHCLEIGCDAALAAALRVRTPRAEWCRAETLDDLASYAEAQFDVALLCDVSHRPWRDPEPLLAAAGRVARRVLVKDRFEDGAHSRTMLRFAGARDGTGRRCLEPERSFTREAFVQLAAGQRLVLAALDSQLQAAPMATGGAASERDGQFIAVLRNLRQPHAAVSHPAQSP